MSGRLFSRSLAPLEPSGHVAEPGLTAKQLHFTTKRSKRKKKVNHALIKLTPHHPFDAFFLRVSMMMVSLSAWREGVMKRPSKALGSTRGCSISDSENFPKILLNMNIPFPFRFFPPISTVH